MLETAAWADHAGGVLVTGRGADRFRKALYAMADVELLPDEAHRTAPSGVFGGRLQLAATTRRRGARQRCGEAIWQSTLRSIKMLCEWAREQWTVADSWSGGETRGETAAFCYNVGRQRT